MYSRACFGLCALLAAVVATPAAAQMKCYAPRWQQLVDPSLGISVEVPAESYSSYGILGDFFTYNRSLRMSGGAAVPGRCSSFSVSVMDFGSKTIGDAEGLFTSEEQRTTKNLRDVKMLGSQRTTVQGLPAREFSYSFTIDFFNTTSTYRVLMVARGNRLYSFSSSWGDAGPRPSDSVRSFQSIRFTSTVPDPNLRSRALLSMAVTEYWRYFPSKPRSFFAPTLLQTLEPRRATDAALIKDWGFYDTDGIRFVGVVDGYRVFRFPHDKGPVLWSVKDDGRYITAIKWQKE